MELANQLELERDHALDRPDKDSDGFIEEDAEMEEANREEKASDTMEKFKFEALESQASFDRVLFDGGEFGFAADVGSLEELDFIGIPGLLEPEQVRDLLRSRQSSPVAEPEAAPLVDHRMLMDLRGELAKNVSAWSARSGMPHGMVHSELRRICGGPAVAQANESQLQTRLKKLQDWFIGRK